MGLGRDSFSHVLSILPKKRHDASLGMAIRTFANRIINRGGRCPCCGRFGKVDVRSLTGNPVYALIWLVHAAGPKRDWVNVPERAPRSVLRTKKLTQLKHWRLIEQQVQPDGKTKRSGIWRPTEKGLEFIRGEIRIPHRVYVFNDQCLGHSDKVIDAQEALGKRYDYQREIGRTWLGERKQ